MGLPIAKAGESESERLPPLSFKTERQRSSGDGGTWNTASGVQPLSWKEPENNGGLESEGFSSEGEWAGQHRRDRGAGALEKRLGGDGSVASRDEVPGSPSVAGMQVAGRACSLAAMKPYSRQVGCSLRLHQPKDSMAWRKSPPPPPSTLSLAFNGETFSDICDSVQP